MTTIAIIVGVLGVSYYGAYRYAMSKADNPNKKALISMMFGLPLAPFYIAAVWVMDAWDRIARKRK